MLIRLSRGQFSQPARKPPDLAGGIERTFRVRSAAHLLRLLTVNWLDLLEVSQNLAAALAAAIPHLFLLQTI